MPNVNALKKFTKKKVNSSALSPTLKKLAKRNINTMKIKQKTSPKTAQQKVYFTLLKTNNRLANLALNNKMLQRLYNVNKPLPRTSAKYSPSKRTARRKSVQTGLKALRRTALPYNLIDRIMTPMMFRSTQKRPPRR
jgi:hypothetical protein